MANPDSEALLRARLFQSSNPEVARRLAAIRPRARTLGAGEIAFAAKDPADCIFLLASPSSAGERPAEPLVQVRLAEEGSERGLRFARIVRGDVFGEAELVSAGLDPRPSARIGTARALTPARLIGIPWIELTGLFDLDPAIRTRLLKLATRRFLDAISAQHSHGHEDPDIVLADWLVEFAADLGVTASNRVTFPRKLNQAEIAEELGVSRETISRRLKEWERSGLVTSSAAGLEVVDYARLARIAGLRSGRDRAALARALSDVAAWLESGDLVGARNIAADMLRYFPSSPELLHAVALAAARSGDRSEAIAVLKDALLTPEGNLEALRERVQRALKNPFAPMEKLALDDWDEDAFEEDDDEAAPQLISPREVERLTADLAALEARLLKDSAFEAGDAPDKVLAERSGRAYEAIWRWAGSWYAGINAAAMALLAGDEKNARRVAGEILRRLPEHPKDYWAAATRAEALLISGDKEAGAAALTDAGATADATDSSKASTALQLNRLSPVLALSEGEIRGGLALKTVALVTGHLFRGAEMDAGAQVEAAKSIRVDAEAIFAKQNVGHLFGALACGTDIVVAEAALDAGISFHTVLPFPASRFAELSVDIGDPKGAEGSWRRRFDDVLARAASLTIVDDELPLDRDLDGHFYYGFRFMAGLALLRAAVLQTDCRLIAVTDAAEPKNMAGAARSVADWLAAGRALDAIHFPVAREAPGGRPRGASAFRPVVFLWDGAGSRADQIAVRKALKSRSIAAAAKEFLVVQRSSRVGGEGTAVVAPTFAAALRFAEACAEGDPAVRIICDFGPALGSDLAPDAKAIARLKAGSDMPGFPPGRPLATLPFAAQGVAEFGLDLEVRAVGRTDEALGESESPARRRSGLPVYRVALRKRTG